MTVARTHSFCPPAAMTTAEIVTKAAELATRRKSKVSVKVPGTIGAGVYSSIGSDDTPEQLARHIETIHDMRRAQPQGSAS